MINLLSNPCIYDYELQLRISKNVASKIQFFLRKTILYFNISEENETESSSFC